MVAFQTAENLNNARQTGIILRFGDGTLAKCKQHNLCLRQPFK